MKQIEIMHANHSQWQNKYSSYLVGVNIVNAMRICCDLM